ncbi:MAG: hypothetical protein IPN15_05915 [Saprospiraceae bacterium]|nr:hypothetical protein [Candidatus Vicinibacter affinis]
MAGRYTVDVTNSIYDELTLSSETISLKVCNTGEDSLELIKIFNSTNGQSWFKNTNWLQPGTSIDQWHGIYTNQLGCVNKIDLSNNNLTGNIHAIRMNSLDTLILSDNNLSGIIPEMEIPFIRNLNLSHNQFSGMLPAALTTWVDLRVLNLGENALSDNIPPDLGDLCELVELRINSNQLKGNFPEQLTFLQNLEIGRVDFKNNINTGDSLVDQFVIFCPYGNDIFLNDSCFNRFNMICSSQCNGNEWDSLNQLKLKWTIDTLMALNCDDNNCSKKTIRSGYVIIRGIKFIFIQSRCYSDEDPTEYDEDVKFYDCSGNIIEHVICINGKQCTSLGVITIEQFENLDYDIKWNCGDTIRNVTTTKDLIKINPKFKNNSIWKNLNCYPIPVKDLLTCKEIENDIPLVLHIYDLRGKRY